MNAQQLYAEAESALARKALILADRACSAAAEKAPGNPVYRTTLAWIRALRTESPTGPNSNPYEEPLAMLARAIEQAPHFGTAYYYRGLILKKLHRFADAARDFGMVVMLDQDAVQKQRAERIVREFEEARRRRQESAATPRSSWLKYRAG